LAEPNQPARLLADPLQDDGGPCDLLVANRRAQNLNMRRIVRR